MKRNISLTIENLTDEEILKEFIKRFECDGAVLLYMEDSMEFGFGRWRSKNGQLWVKELFKTIKSAPISNIHIKERNRLRKKNSATH